MLNELSKILAFHGVRNNTILEDLHSKGKVSQEEMMNLNKQVTDNIYTLLKLYLFTPEDDLKDAFFQIIIEYPKYWQNPKLTDWGEMLLKTK